MPPPELCPTCRAQVPVPPRVEPGDALTCPYCAEVFVPTWLQPGGYDPMREQGYGVGDRAADPERADKRRKAKAMMAHGREEYRNRRRGTGVTGGGAEVILLILAVVLGVAVPLGYILARRPPRLGEGVLIGVAYTGLLLVCGIRLILTRTRVGG